MKIIFLDIDGVLNSNEYYNSLSNEEKHGYEYDIDIEKVKLLKEIVDATGAEIVLSSTWRMLREIDGEPALAMFIHLENILKEYGMEIKDYTPVISNNRPLEICTWILSNEKEVESYVSLDDDFTKEEYEDVGLVGCLVQTHYWRSPGGLQREHVEQAIKILNENEVEI
jgi:hypothetical protein